MFVILPVLGFEFYIEIYMGKVPKRLSEFLHVLGTSVGRMTSGKGYHLCSVDKYLYQKRGKTNALSIRAERGCINLSPGYT